MKKYILNLLAQRDNIRTEEQELAALIGLYNQEQPEIDFVNWLYNNLSGPYFVFHTVGNRGRIEVQWRDESRRVGTIQCYNAEPEERIVSEIQLELEETTVSLSQFLQVNCIDDPQLTNVELAEILSLCRNTGRKKTAAK